jgi:dihydroflavonol-4-reductase
VEETMILITGATGFLGSHVLYALLQKQERVAALKRPSAGTATIREIFSFYTGDPDGLMERIDWRTGDMLDRESLDEAMQGISGVINCAAIVSFDPGDRKRLIESNIRGAQNLADAIRVRRQESGLWLIHVSSTSALGDGPGNDPKFLIDENTPRNPERKHSGYSVSKFESEKVVRELVPDAVVLNPGIILGPGQWDKGSSILFARAAAGIRYYPYGGTGYIDVRDVADIITCISSLLSPPEGNGPGASFMGERFCLVGANLRYREFFNLVTDELGIRNPSIYAGKFMTEAAWRMEYIRALLTGRPAVLTRETAEASQRISYYRSDRIRNTLDFVFRPVEETVGWIVSCRQRKGV